jgi:hypothetical protein
MVLQRRMAKCLPLLGAVLIFGVCHAADAIAQVVGPPTNLGFERGLEGWTTFTTAGGTLGSESLPTTMNISMNGRPVSKAAAFTAGQQLPPDTSTEKGGGLLQRFRAPAGRLRVFVDIGEFFALEGMVEATGTFWLMVDGQLLSSQDMGNLNTHGTKSSRLAGTLDIAEGVHTLVIAVTRPYGNPGVVYHFIDNVVLAMDLEDVAPAAPTNLDFERGLSRWTAVKTAGGTLGAPPFPNTRSVSLDGKPRSNAVAFSAGQRNAAESGSSEQGGGLAQVFQAPAGRLLAFVDVAAQAANAEAAGTFWVMADGQLLATVDMGHVQGYNPPCFPTTPVCPPFVYGFKSFRLEGQLQIAAGTHSLAIVATRQVASDGLVQHLVDHVVLAMDLSVDEPPVDPGVSP